MHAAVQDAVETLRQLQKLSRELQPVKNALATLIKRERASPNPAAAAGSLDKIALRVSDVSRKYGAFIDRLSLLLENELPQLQIINCLVGVCGENGQDSPAVDKSKKSGSCVDDPFRVVCPPAVPYMLNSVDYHIVCRTVRLHIEMVDYIVATERYQLARHVADAYGLPLYLFPKLAALVLPPLPPIQNSAPGNDAKGRESISLPSSNVVSPFLGSVQAKTLCCPNWSLPQCSVVAPEHIAIQCIERRHSVTEAIAYCEERLLPALESISVEVRPRDMEKLYDLLLDLHATRIVQMFREGETRQGNIHAYLAKNILPWATRRPLFVQRIINFLTLVGESSSVVEATAEGSVGDEVTSSDKSRGPLAGVLQKKEEAIRLVECMMSAEGFHKLTTLFHRIAILAGSQILSLADALEKRRNLGAAGVAGTEDQSSKTPPVLPDLVARLVATSMLLKDEYIDRMVIERSQDAKTGDTDKEMLVPASHLCTQSGSFAFDSAIMTVIENMLALFTHESQSSGVEDMGSVGSNHCAGYGSRALEAKEILAADERWGNEVLFIRRHTRFYCYVTRECFDGSCSGNYPLALPNGTVVSKFAVLQCCMKKIGEDNRVKTVVVCPRTKEEFPLSQLKRVYVT
ncbi:hypothetical protein ERJ75_001417600 [Trypanosoma vivax]|uniref:Uncharacterized protein n=1 Tax=Trypanosoma vivax (strain Y486) TaxID=1055687 RepID=G0TUH5_TRYVY|nr:hypothetical protein TRVL_03813 [Trypanosoma vivax]KAH8607396.1 hypothetical protein ERJ75_001417600 [Trypanosoma vivax]CCC47609.1 conserved hypothetical protein [Trypanosoma vivax Y486]